jgi:benzoyl-CoA reductase/2-hydroxyglutaryl-CoA dehydratase subunit BcrC/BadD/HgdB
MCIRDRIDTVWQGCHTFNVESALVKKVVTDDLEIQYLKLETDYSSADTGQLSTRIEAFLETIKS